MVEFLAQDVSIKAGTAVFVSYMIVTAKLYHEPTGDDDEREEWILLPLRIFFVFGCLLLRPCQASRSMPLK